MHDYTRLRVYNEAMTIVSSVYRLTDKFPASERFELVSQMRRAATSIPANIAEGAGRASSGDFRRFIRIAAGSANEVASYFDMCVMLGLLAPDEVQDVKTELSSLSMGLSGLDRHLS